jgi:hypothetical protein
VNILHNTQNSTLLIIILGICLGSAISMVHTIRSSNRVTMIILLLLLNILILSQLGSDHNDYQRLIQLGLFVALATWLFHAVAKREVGIIVVSGFGALFISYLMRLPAQ